MSKIREGDLYKSLNIDGVTLRIYYGYGSESEERYGWEPTPQYPNFQARPVYTAEGVPLVTADQDVCAHFYPKATVSGEGWCNDCVHLERYEEFIGLCRCPHNRVRQNE